MNALLLAAHDGQHLDPAVASAVAAALPLVQGGCVDILVAGHQMATVAAQAAALAGIGTVYVADAPALASLNAETLARQIVRQCAGYRWVIGLHNLQARAALPRAAALAQAAYLSDVTRTAPDALERPAYAGAVTTRVQPLTEAVFLTIRASAFAPVQATASPARIEAAEAVQADTRSRVTGTEAVASSRPDLGRARLIVSGGRGVGSVENMAKVEALADHLGAAVGASRAAVDAGFAPNAVQIGQTGKVVAPQLYLALGISGAIQHLAGIKDAQCIVAINKDAEAPIFQIADYGVVGDLFEALPVLQAGLRPQGDAA